MLLPTPRLCFLLGWCHSQNAPLHPISLATPAKSKLFLNAAGRSLEVSIIAPTWGLVPVRESVTVAGAWGALLRPSWSQGGISSFPG